MPGVIYHSATTDEQTRAGNQVEIMEMIPLSLLKLILCVCVCVHSRVFV